MAQYSDLESVKALSIPNTEFLQWTKTVPGPPPDLADLDNFRKTINTALATKLALLPPSPSVKEDLISIAMRDGHLCPAKTFIPISSSPGPLIVLIHGGGFALGSEDVMTPLARNIATIFGATVVNTSYRLAPEHKWPTAHNDSWDAFCWIIKHISDLNADVSKGFIVGGVSAGANISAVIAQQALYNSVTPKITGLWLSVPPFFAKADDVPEPYRHLWISRTQNAEVPGMSMKELTLFGEWYSADYESEWYTPYKSAKPHTGTPKAYIQVNGLDPLRDDGLVHQKVLADHGVETRMDVFPGLPHAHAGLLPPTLKCVQDAMKDTFAGIAWLLDAKLDEAVLQPQLAPPEPN